MQGIFAWVGGVLQLWRVGMLDLARPSTAGLLAENQISERLGKTGEGLSDPAAVMVVEWRRRAAKLRRRAGWYLVYIFGALILGLVLVWAAKFLVEFDIEAVGAAESELIKKRNREALDQLTIAEKQLTDRWNAKIDEMQELLRGGGTIWHQGDTDTDTTANLSAMHFADEKTGWVVGDEGTILHTTDGEKWTKAETGTTADLWGVHFADEKTGWAIGSGGNILYTTDGESWKQAETGTKSALWEMHFADAKTGWVVGDKGNILYTTDGETWTKADTGTTADLSKLYFANRKNGWVIGKEGTILYTTNGETWTKAEPDTTAALWEMHFADEKTGWVIGREGTILHTTDGKSWTKAEINTTADFWKIHFVKDKTAWVIGTEGTILHTADGITWEKIEADTTEPLTATLTEIHFADENTGWVIGREGTILHTTDGMTWTKIETGTTATLGEMYFANAETGWAIGFGGTILHTADGKAWTKSDSGTTNILTMLHFADARTGWVIGFGGTLLATRDYDLTLEGLTIEAQIKELEATPLKDILEKKGFLGELRTISRSLGENKEKQKSVEMDLEASEKPGDSETDPDAKSTGGPPDKTDGKVSGTVLLQTSLLQTSIIRITTILLIAFLVQILVGLYRYNTRLAGYYDARADAVLMTKFAGMEFEKLVQLFSPDTVAFGRQPRSPAGNAVAVAREALRSIR